VAGRQLGDGAGEASRGLGAGRRAGAMSRRNEQRTRAMGAAGKHGEQVRGPGAPTCRHTQEEGGKQGRGEQGQMAAEG
jgi:hypothetical protein